MSITIKRTEKQIRVASPYNPDLPEAARKLGGKWQSTSREWVFDLRDEARVAELYRSVYGQWDEGELPADAVTVRVRLFQGWYRRHSGLFFAGRELAHATGRDSGARQAEGVIVLEGEFTSGGSVKNWTTCAEAGTVFELRDVSAAKVQEEQDDDDKAYPKFHIEVLGDPDTLAIAALQAERKRLVARIAEIDAELGTTTTSKRTPS